MLHRPPKLLRLLYPELVWEVPVTEKKLFLSFDDGPIPEVTFTVLNMLNDYGVKATFFCIGDNAKKYPEVLRHVVEAGHAIGNHTMHHVNGWKTKTSKYALETEECSYFLPKTKLFRPPYGRISRQQIQVLKNQYKIVMWTNLSGDYLPNINPEKCLQGTLKANRNGTITVFHDSLKAKKNLLYVLPRYLEESLHQGYTFHTLLDA